jgi:hypothetical protein
VLFFFVSAIDCVWRVGPVSNARVLAGEPSTRLYTGREDIIFETCVSLLPQEQLLLLPTWIVSRGQLDNLSTLF